MDKVYDFFMDLINKQLVGSIIVVIISLLLYKLVNHILTKGENKIVNGKRGKTYAKLVKSVIRYIFVIITILILLNINGVDVSSALAGVGIISVIIGLALQDWLKDIIRGSSIISDNYFSVGDVVKYKGEEGKVIIIGLKSTKIQDLKTGNIRTIANRNIEEIDVVSNIIYIDVPMSYELPLDKAEKVVNEIVNEAKKIKDIDNCTYVGINSLESSSINYYLKIECNPLNKLQVRRDCLRTIIKTMEKNGVEVPFTQVDIHNK